MRRLDIEELMQVAYGTLTLTNGVVLGGPFFLHVTPSEWVFRREDGSVVVPFNSVLMAERQPLE